MHCSSCLIFQREENKVLTKEEKQAEAERLKKIQEEADLKLAKEAFGKYHKYFLE